jgi:uncharacterized protein (DUF1330 family)
MSAIVIIQGTLHADKQETLQQYQQTARQVVGKHGGEVIIRGSSGNKLSGARQWQVGLVVRFPDKAAVEAWYNDPDYQKVLPLRDQAYAELEINVYQE